MVRSDHLLFSFSADRSASSPPWFFRPSLQPLSERDLRRWQTSLFSRKTHLFTAQTRLHLEEADLILPKTDLVSSETRVYFRETSLFFVKTNLFFPKTHLLFQKANVFLAKARVFFVGTSLFFPNTRLFFRSKVTESSKMLRNPDGYAGSAEIPPRPPCRNFNNGEDKPQNQGGYNG